MAAWRHRIGIIVPSWNTVMKYQTQLLKQLSVRHPVRAEVRMELGGSLLGVVECLHSDMRVACRECQLRLRGRWSSSLLPLLLLLFKVIEQVVAPQLLRDAVYIVFPCALSQRFP